jgi:hypothetical protein
LLPQGQVLQPELSRGLAQRGEAIQHSAQTSPQRREKQREFDQPQGLQIDLNILEGQSDCRAPATLDRTRASY